MKKAISKIRDFIKRIGSFFEGSLKKIDKIFEPIRINNQVYWIGVAVLFLWFVFQLVFFAVKIRYNIAPDEIHHYKVIHFCLERENLLPFIKDQGGEFFFGDLTRNPSYLYHYLVSLILRIPGFLQKEFLILRAISIGFSAGTFMIFVAILEQLTNRKYLKLLSLFIFSNTLMLTFIGMGISYDLPMNFFSLLSFWLLIKIYKTYEIKFTIWFFILGMFNSIIKFTYTPLFFIQTVFIVGAYINAGKFNVKDLLKEIFQIKRWHLALIGVLGIIGFGLFAEKYLVNLVQYSSLVPACDRIHTVEECMQNGVNRRNAEFELNPGPDRFMSAVEFVPRWLLRSYETIYGVTAHLELGFNSLTVYGMLGVCLLGIILFLNSKLQGKNRFYVVLMSICVFYISINAVQNYYYLGKFGWFGVALQGRYLFPVYPVFLFLTNYYVFDFLKYRVLKGIYTIFLVVILVYGGFLFFVKNAGSEWYGPDDPSDPWGHLSAYNYSRDDFRSAEYIYGVAG